MAALKSRVLDTAYANTLQERYNFYQRCQRAQETLFEFVEDVQRLAKSCQFHVDEEELLIRDRVLFGLRDVCLQKQIVELGGNPSLNATVMLCQETSKGDTCTSHSNVKYLDQKAEEISVKIEPNIFWINNDAESVNLDIADKAEPCPKSSPPKELRRKNVLTCTDCSKSFKSKSRLKDHYCQVHEKSATCNLCEKVLKSPTSLRRHIRHHHEHIADNPDEPLSFECYICKKELRSRSTLRFHIYHHSRIKKWLCTKCGMQFVAESQLKIHLMRDDHNISTVENSKPFVCKTCNKRFTQKNSLDTHHRVHSGEKPFACKSCDKRFASISNLNQHLRTHSDKKPYQCNFCEYQCRYPGNLRNHMRVHAGKQ